MRFNDVVVTDFTPIPSLVGGVMIGAAAVTLMLATGRIAGVSGFVSRLLPPYGDKHFAVRAAFVAGRYAEGEEHGERIPCLLKTILVLSSK